MKKKEMVIIGICCLFSFGQFIFLPFAQGVEVPMPSIHVEGGSYYTAPQSKEAASFEAKPVFDYIDSSVILGTQWKQGLRVLSATSQNLIGIIVKQEIYDGCRDNLQFFIADLQDMGYRIYMETVTGGKPADLRERLNTRQADGLRGAYFVGSGDPMVAWYEMADDFFGYSQFPIDIYFANFTGEWYDDDGNGIFDRHTGDDHIQIWISRISFGVFGDEVADVNYYLSKHHYWAQNWGVYKKTKGSALIYVDDDWQFMGDQLKQEIGGIYPQVDVFNDPSLTTGPDYLQRIQEPQYDFVSLWAHGNINVHAFKTPSGNASYIDADDVIEAKPQGFFYNLYSCEVANYTGLYNKGDSYIQPYIGGAYLLIGNGLVVVSQTKVGGMAYPGSFHSVLAQGKNFGDAFIDWWHDSGFTSDKDRRQWQWGHVILGSAVWSVNGSGIRVQPGTKLNVSANVFEMTVGVSQSLTITVTAGVGGPSVLGATVNLSGAGLGCVAYTDTNGIAVFKDITPLSSGQITIVAEKTGYESGSVSITAKSYNLTVSLDVSQITLGAQNLTITAYVSADGSSIFGAEISISGAGLGAVGPAKSGQFLCFTDNNGKATFQDITPFSSGQITVVAEKTGYKSGAATILVKMQPKLSIATNVYQMTANVLSSLKIVVTDENMSFVSGATIKLSGAGVTMSAVTDSSGAATFQVTPLLAGTITVAAEKSGYPSTAIWISVILPNLLVSADVYEMTVGVPQNLVVTVTTEGPTKSPVSGASVKLNGAGVVASAVTDSSGAATFQVTAPEVGDIMVAAEKNGYRLTNAWIWVRPKTIYYRIDGRVTDNSGAGLSRVKVVGHEASVYGDSCPFGPIPPDVVATSDADGNYSLTITIYPGGGWQGCCGWVKLTASKPGYTFVDIPRFRIEGVGKNLYISAN